MISKAMRPEIIIRFFASYQVRPLPLGIRIQHYLQLLVRYPSFIMSVCDNFHLPFTLAYTHYLEEEACPKGLWTEFIRPCSTSMEHILFLKDIVANIPKIAVRHFQPQQNIL